MNTRFLAVGIAVLVLCACDDRQAPPTTPSPVTVTPPTPPAPTAVRGRVVDFQTARPIGGAVVAFSEFTSIPAGTPTAATDADGQYSLQAPPVNGRRYYVVVNNQTVGNAYLSGENKRAGDVAIHDGRCVTRYGLVLDRSTYRPIVGAQILNLSNVVLATTDKDGWYQFDFGCLGPYGFNTTWVVATHPYYTPQNFSGGRGWSQVIRDDVALSRK